jgi:hypothetical protein
MISNEFRYFAECEVEKAAIAQFIKQKYQIFIGAGKDVTIDRAYIRQKYDDVCSNKCALLAVQRIQVYLPCTLLQKGAQIGKTTLQLQFLQAKLIYQG